MDIRPIVTDDDYEAALAEIKRLWSAEAGSPEAQKIEVLAILSGKRSLTLEMVQKLHYRLGIPLESLVVPERRRARRPTARRKLQGKRHGQHRAA
jgi:antitoxin component HigA of HigAB toxin-antitoxin module